MRTCDGGPARIHHSLQANFFGPRNSAIDSPFYFVDGSFVGPDGPASFHGSREYLSLPGLRKVIVDRWTYTEYARNTWIPVSSLAAYTAGIRFAENLPPVAEWNFVDLETDADGFKLGVVNDQVFTNPRALVDEVLAKRDSGRRVVCSFNGFRFDNRVLGQLGLLPCLTLGSYNISYFPGMLNVDLWFWARNHFPDAESKSLRDLAASEGYPVDDSKRTEYDEIRAAEDNKMSRFLAEKIDVRTAWKLMMRLTNCCPLILQNVFLDRTHKAILHSWYLEHGYLPLEYPAPGDPNPVRGPVRNAVPGIYENVAMVDVRNAYVTRASSRQLRIYDDEDPPAFTSVMRRFLELIAEYPSQKSMLKFLAVSLVGSQGSDNNFMRRQSVYSEIVEGFAQGFTEYLSRLPVKPVYVHTDGYLAPADFDIPPFKGYELSVKGRYVWIAVYDKQRTIGLLAGESPRVKAKGFPGYANSFPMVLRWMRDRFYEGLADVSDIREVRRILLDPRRFVRERIKLPRDRMLWSSTIWKESEMFPARWDPRTPIWNAWSGFKLGPNKYTWPRLWVRYKIEEMLDQHRLPLEIQQMTSHRQKRRQ